MSRERLAAIRDSEQLGTVAKAAVDQPRWTAVLWILHTLLDVVGDLVEAVHRDPSSRTGSSPD